MRKKLLLHTCCAPCLTQCIRVLAGIDSWKNAISQKEDYVITILFDNPNIYPAEEYIKRKAEVKKFLEIFSKTFFPVEMIEDQSEKRRDGFLEFARKHPFEKEKGIRCTLCYEYRLRETFEKARKGGFDIVATTLTLSPLKDEKKVNEIGNNLSSIFKVEYLKSNFKKNEGFKKSIDLCKEYGIYRQKYCGCAFSVR